MAHWLEEISAGGDGKVSNRWKYFCMDQASDVDGLPTTEALGTGGLAKVDNELCAVGSEALALAESIIFKLNSENEWVEL